MRKILATAAGFLTTAYLSTIHWLNAHPNWKYTLIALSCFLALALAIFILKKILKTIRASLFSTLFMATAGIILGILNAHGVLKPAALYYYIGLPIGFFFCLSLIRAIGGAAQKSVVFGELFAFITSYKIRGYLRERNNANQIIDVEDVLDEDADYKNLLTVLSDKGLKKKEALECANFAIQTVPNGTLEDKIRVAFQHINTKTEN